MITETSRYRDVGTAVVTVAGPDGRPRTVAYLLRRFLPPLEVDPENPPPPGSPTLAESGLEVTASGGTVSEHRVQDHDRLDVLAWQYLGDPLRFWQIADANPCVFPDELTSELDRRIVVPSGGVGTTATATGLR